MSFHRLAPVKKHRKPAPDPKKPAPRKHHLHAVHAPKSRPVGDKG
ncbi:hypothetical protein SRB17_62510 [Streptomyces sp. RB17]|nr:hypothetical protein [Streptomyces sp. RB17]MQY38241.1 hypothetical protein [Streptomyces sp. RB17]